MPTISRSVLPLKKAATSSSCATAEERGARKTSRASSVFLIAAEPQLESIRQRGGRLLAGHDRNDFEVHQIGPFGDPLLKESDVAAFHQLETTAEVGCDPAVHEFQTVGHEPALLMEPPVHRFSVLVAELLDHHEQHDKSRAVPKLHHAAARSSPGVSGNFTGCLRLADKSSALVSIRRLCASAAVAACVGRPSAIRLSQDSVSSRIGPRNSPSTMSPGG